MRNRIARLITFALVGLAIGTCLPGCRSQTHSIQGSLVDVKVEEIALMPFLVSQTTSPDALITAAPNHADSEAAMIDRFDLPDDADQIMNRIVAAELKSRFEERLVPPGIVDAAYQPMSIDPSLDTPRKRAVRLGTALEANLVMVGTIWWFRERGALMHLPDNPASVGFELYLIHVETGARLWRGRFEGTQETLTSDVLGGVERLDMGLRWLSATELARYGVKSVLSKLPLK